MATDATFDNQLQALATATANFANGKDAQIKNTIITALGGSTQSGGELLDPHLTWDGIDSSLVTWEGNGVCKFAKEVTTNADPEIVAKNSYLSGRGFLMLESDGTYAKDWIYVHYSGPT